MSDPLLDDLLDWLRIPSISTGGGKPEDLQRAAQWACERIDGAGGDAKLLITHGNPIAYGEFKAGAADAPTVLIYGHYDVQSIGDPDAWRSDPFEPELRDGRLYARGASDDKGNFWPLLYAACELHKAGELPVNVRVAIEGEEEAAGVSIAEWLREDEGPADCAIVFDSGMVDERTPAITLGLRGMVFASVTVRTGVRDLHSGMYGGSVLNAAHVLHRMLANVLPGADGIPNADLRAGVAPPDPAELDSWKALPPGDQVISEVGGRPVSPDAGTRFYERNGADTAVELNEFVSGEPRTIVPATAKASVSVRLAPGQDSATVKATLERLLRQDVPAGADVEIGFETGEPSLFDVNDPAIQLAAEGMRKATGMTPAFVRSGGSIPIVAEFAAKGIPTIVSGFGLPADDIHAPNESYRVESLRMGETTAREMYRSLARL
ncbi:MAG: hypothetical protein QOF76_2234 [Solirubrobacteraceae bacterium]|jgi:acetylornithine deacetylase/succinyl-diaminopimelate desuccinylase-like protein|nr:hypothetical protein [Solirubrobacteraceae bacterium]